MALEVYAVPQIRNTFPLCFTFKSNTVIQLIRYSITANQFPMKFLSPKAWKGDSHDIHRHRDKPMNYGSVDK